MTKSKKPISTMFDAMRSMFSKGKAKTPEPEIGAPYNVTLGEVPLPEEEKSWGYDPVLRTKYNLDFAEFRRFIIEAKPGTGVRITADTIIAGLNAISEKQPKLTPDQVVHAFKEKYKINDIPIEQRREGYTVDHQRFVSYAHFQNIKDTLGITSAAMLSTFREIESKIGPNRTPFTSQFVLFLSSPENKESYAPQQLTAADAFLELKKKYGLALTELEQKRIQRSTDYRVL